METIIEIKHLTKEYEHVKAVDDLSFEVYQGEILGLLGPNGSGKSTTINCLLSLLNYQQGSIVIFNKQMKPDAYDIKKDIGVVFQDVAVFEELTVYENIDYFCGLYIHNKKTRKQYIEDAIALVGLSQYRQFYPKQLSGGLLRRLNIACGIAHKPKLIIFDEPTVAVDPQSRNNILEGIKKLRNQGATIIYTTHYMEEVEMICDRIIILDKGKIIAMGNAEKLKTLVRIEEKVTVETTQLEQEIISQLQNHPDIESVMTHENGVTLTYRNGHHHVVEVIQFFNEHGLSFQNIYSQRPTLNDVFLELTGKELRD